MRRLAVLGASGHGKVVGDAALAAGWQAAIFYDDAWPQVTAVGPWRVVGTGADLLGADRRFDGAIVAIGDNRTRLAKHRLLLDRGVPVVSVRHPAGVVSPYAEIGPGSVVCAGAVVGAFARVGAACIINTGASVDHDCVLAAGVHVSPGAVLGGNVRVGEASWIGLGAAVRHGISIGAGALIGAGAVVVEDVDDGVTAVGVPARAIRGERLE